MKITFSLNASLKLCLKGGLWEFNAGRRVYFNHIVHLPKTNHWITDDFHPKPNPSTSLLIYQPNKDRFLLQAPSILPTIRVIQHGNPVSYIFWLQLICLMKYFNFKREQTIGLVHIPKCFTMCHCDIFGTFGVPMALNISYN